MADLSNFVHWDPGVVEAHQVAGDGPGPDAVFDVAVRGVRSPLVLRYRTETYRPPEVVVVRAVSRLLTSLDTITVSADGDGAIVTYDAQLLLNGPLRRLSGLLSPVFGRIAERAAVGLVRVLDGTRLATTP